MLNKNQVAQLLAEAHREVDPSISRIVRLVSDLENEGHEPVKLLEVNPYTSPSGIVPVAFGADPPSVPYPSVVVEVTEDEYRQIVQGTLPLPSGWRLGDPLYPIAA
jgi:hypothetical protein